MATILELALLALNSKNAVKTAIIEKGIEVGDVFSEYADAIGSVYDKGYNAGHLDVYDSNVIEGCLVMYGEITSDECVTPKILGPSDIIDGCGTVYKEGTMVLAGSGSVDTGGVDECGCLFIIQAYYDSTYLGCLQGGGSFEMNEYNPTWQSGLPGNVFVADNSGGGSAILGIPDVNGTTYHLADDCGNLYEDGCLVQAGHGYIDGSYALKQYFEYVYDGSGCIIDIDYNKFTWGPFSDNEWINGSGCTLGCYDALDGGCSLEGCGRSGCLFVVGSGLVESGANIDVVKRYLESYDDANGTICYDYWGSFGCNEWINGCGCTLDAWDGINGEGFSLIHDCGCGGLAMVIGSGMVADNEWVNGCGNPLKAWYGINDLGESLEDCGCTGSAMVIGSGIVADNEWVNGCGCYLSSICNEGSIYKFTNGSFEEYEEYTE